MMRHSHEQQKPPLTVFLAAIVVFFFLALSSADSVGFVPCALDGSCPQADNSDLLPDLQPINDVTFGSAASPSPGAAKPAVATSTTPKRMKISAIGLDLPVQNPATTDLSVLDQLLQYGPARHALSGKIGDDRNMIIFAHSSHLPIVHNQMYRAFNRVPELSVGDTIELDGADGKAYLYRISAPVEKADTTNFDENFLGSPEKKLILVTCDTLTGKSARYIARADFVGVED